MKGPGITINSRGLIAGRPDFRGLYHETVQQYLNRGGVIKRVPSTWTEYQTSRVRENFRAQNRKG
jgi:hypothetical protein